MSEIARRIPQVRAILVGTSRRWSPRPSRSRKYLRTNLKRSYTYRERALELVRQKPVLLDPEALRTDIFESDEELEEFIEDIYRYRRSFKA